MVTTWGIFTYKGMSISSLTGLNMPMTRIPIVGMIRICHVAMVHLKNHLRSAGGAAPSTRRESPCGPVRKVGPFGSHLHGYAKLPFKKINNIYTNGHWSMFSIFLGLPENSLRVHLASSTDVGG